MPLKNLDVFAITLLAIKHPQRSYLFSMSVCKQKSSNKILFFYLHYACVLQSSETHCMKNNIENYLELLLFIVSIDRNFE